MLKTIPKVENRVVVMMGKGGRHPKTDWHTDRLDLTDLKNRSLAAKQIPKNDYEQTYFCIMCGNTQ